MQHATNHHASLTSRGTLVRNVIWNGLGEAAPLCAALVAMPIVIHRLGTERFGMLALAWTIFSYFSVFDFGLSSALTKLISGRLASGRREEIPSLIATALVLMLALALAAAALLALCAGALVQHMFRVPGELRLEARDALRLLILGLPVCVTAFALTATLAAYQRFDFLNLVEGPRAAFSSLAPLCVLPFSHSIVPIVALLLAGPAVAWVVCFAMCMRTVPGLVRSMVPRRALVGELFGFGAWVVGSNLSALLSGSFDRFVIAAIDSMNAVSYYVLPARILHKLRILPELIGKVAFPALSYEIAGNPARARRLFRRAANAVFLIVFPVTLLIVAFPAELLTLWIGPEFAAHSATLVRLLALGALAESMMRVPKSLLWALHRPDLPAKIAAGVLPFYLAFMVAMVYLHGAEGAALAWLARAAIEAAAIWIAARAVAPDTARGTIQFVCFACGAVVMGAVMMIPAVAARGLLVTAALLALALSAWRVLLDEEERAMLGRLVRPRAEAPAAAVPAADLREQRTPLGEAAQ